MKWFVLLNAIIEIAAGIVFMFMPGLIPGFDSADTQTHLVCRMYGAAALALGFYALLAFMHFGEGPLRGFLKTFTVFHLGVALANFHGFRAGLEDCAGALGLHGVLGVICLILLLTRNKPLA